MHARNALILSLALGLAGGAHAGSGFRAAKRDAVRALQRADQDVRSRTTCNQSQGDNLRDALRRAKAINPRTRPGEPEELKLFLAGLALGAAFSGCPDTLYSHLTQAQGALGELALELQGRAPARAERYDDEPEDEPRRERGLFAEVLVDPDATGRRREPALLVRAERVEAEGLRGKTLSWKLLVKPARQRGWRRAASYKIGTQKVRRASERLPDVELTVRYSTLERDGLDPGPHDAALVATSRGREVFREELELDIPDFEAFERRSRSVAVRAARERPPVGPYAMSDQAFRGFAGSVQRTASDFSKVDMIQKAARKNHFTAAQLGVLLDATASDFSKMDVAKAVIPKLVDPENAYGLADKFTSSFSKEEFTGLL